MKAADELTPSDLTTYRVWEFADDMEGELPDETYMRPVEELPVNSLSGRLASTHVTLANCQRLLALLGNIDLADPVWTEHFLTISSSAPLGRDLISPATTMLITDGTVPQRWQLFSACL
jgi:hypothetical protein